ncbi:MAG: IPExxxVDY family protein, partial [Crocinitomicaceae bacterium]|nr:IPExxxVDY family protein [Crocinitomicaceae bacterium]
KKTKRYELTFEDDTAIEVYGLSSAYIDYRLAWELNSFFTIQLEKMEEKMEVEDRKTKLLNSFFVYFFSDEENWTEYYLIRNKQENCYLVTGMQFVDYFLVIKENKTYSSEELLSSLRTINGIVAVFPIDEELDFIEHLS